MRRSHTRLKYGELQLDPPFLFTTYCIGSALYNWRKFTPSFTSSLWSRMWSCSNAKLRHSGQLEKFRTCDSKLSRSFPCAGMGGGGIKSNRDLKEACLVLFWLSIPLWVFMLEVDVPSLPSFKFIRSPTKLYSVLLTSSAGAGASVSSPSLPIFFPKSSNTSVLSGICFSFYI